MTNTQYLEYLQKIKDCANGINRGYIFKPSIDIEGIINELNEGKEDLQKKTLKDLNNLYIEVFTLEQIILNFEEILQCLKTRKRFGNQ